MHKQALISLWTKASAMVKSYSNLERFYAITFALILAAILLVF